MVDKRNPVPAARLVFREVNQSRWRDLERLFEAPGGPKHCWCVVWSSMPKEASRADKRAKKAALRGLVRRNMPIGILGYLGGEPAAWCSIAPKTTYRDLGGVADPGEDPAKVWAVVCFFVPRRLRGRGVMKQLLEAAIEHAKGNGAAAVEAYPVDPGSPSYRFMGFTTAFTAAGFREVSRAGARRHVMRLAL